MKLSSPKFPTLDSILETTGLQSSTGRQHRTSLPKLAVDNTSRQEHSVSIQVSLPTLTHIRSEQRLTLPKFNRINPQFVSFDEAKMKQLTVLNQKRDIIYKHISRNQIDQAIEEMQSTTSLSVQHGSLSVFQRCLEVLADMYTTNREFQNAIHSYNQLRIIAELTGNNKLKIQALLEMADTCRILGCYKESKILLKKALQYIWFIGDAEQETIIYDRLGMVFYLMADMGRARYFHKRAMNQLVETDNSPVKRHAIETTRQHLKEIPHHNAVLNAGLLAKIGMLGEPQDIPVDAQWLIQQDDKQGIPNLRFRTTMDVQHQLDNILQENEFAVEISNPNSIPISDHQDPNELVTNEGIIRDEHMRSFAPEIINLHKVMARKKYFQKIYDQTRRKEPVAMQKGVLKQGINQQIRDRLVNQSKELTSVDRFKLELQKHNHSHFQTESTNMDRIMLNHLSPNRNSEGFLYHAKPLKPKTKKCFDEFASSVLVTHI